VQSYFTDNTTSTLPPTFHTSCSGLCGSSGWRAHAAYLDSGFHGLNAVDSDLHLGATLGTDGVLNFTYFLYTNGTSSGLQFFIGTTQYALPISDQQFAEVPVSIPLPAGSYDFVWNYHQEFGTFGVATVRNLILVGDVSGNATLASLVPCPLGQYAQDPSDPQCTLCPPGSFASSNASTGCSVCPLNTANFIYGQSQCQTCSVGTYTKQQGSQSCVTDCVFSPFAGSTQTFNLTTLPTTSIYDASRRLYYINVCQPIGNVCPDAYVCVENLDGTFDEIGNSVRVIPQNASSLAPFSLAFDNGPATAQCPNGTSTLVQFQCDPTANPGYPTLVSDQGCVYTFNWLSIASCPVCSDADYQTVTGVCEGGNRQISKTRLSQCNGPSSIAVPSEGCSAAEFPTGAIVGVVIAFVVVVAIAGVIIWRNRRLSQQYNSLRERSNSVSGESSGL